MDDSTRTQAYALARLPIGMSFLGHGLVRVPKLSTFAEGMAAGFADTWLPQVLVGLFGYALPVVELLLGAILLAGIAMRKSAAFGVMLMVILIFGSTLQENWSGVATQLFYSLYFVGLFLWARFNGYAFFNSTT